MPVADDVLTGPGLLYAAPLGTTEPTDATTALPGAWREVGYTDEGSTFSYELNTEQVEVAETLDPIRQVNTSRTITIAFAMAEMSRRNLALALNAGANAANTGAYEPPELGTEVRVMLVWHGDGAQRWVLRKCFQTSNVEINRGKLPAKSLMTVVFGLEKPTGLAPFKVFPNASGQV